MADAKKTATKKTATKSNKKKWETTGGALKPVDLSKIVWDKKSSK